eukprot:6181092-Pleurochrysis_carterae.AAC.2
MQLVHGQDHRVGELTYPLHVTLGSKISLDTWKREFVIQVYNPNSSLCSLCCFSTGISLASCTYNRTRSAVNAPKSIWCARLSFNKTTR